MAEAVKNPSPVFEAPEDGKRFYVPGCQIHATCPGCAKVRIFDFEDQYFDYPIFNKPFKQALHCACGREWFVRVKIAFTVSLLKMERTERERPEKTLADAHRTIQNKKKVKR